MVNNGRLFEFENGFFNNPKVLGFVDILQIGEVSLLPGYVMPSHRQSCDEITFVISGEGYFYTDDQQFLVKSGEIHFIPSGKCHKIVVTKQQNLRYVYLGFNFNSKADTPELKKLKRIIETSGIYHIIDNGNIRMMLYMLIDEMYNRSEYNEIMTESYINQVLVQFYRLLTSEHFESYRPEQSTGIIGEPIFSIINFIDNHITDIESIHEISSTFGYSHSYVSHLFKTKMGITLQQYVTKKKIETSLDLIKAGAYSITQIAFMLHYESVQSFGKAFKKNMDFTPSDYKRQLQSNNPKE